MEKIICDNCGGEIEEGDDVFPLGSMTVCQDCHECEEGQDGEEI
jgi:hypothetical protein